MVTAMERVETPGSRLILAGLFTERDLEQQARALAGWQRVDYHGWLEIHRGSQTCSVRLAPVSCSSMTCPTTSQAYPNKLFECMSVGLPVIASHFPLWRSIIEGDRCGLLVDPRDTTAIAKAIDWVLTHPEEAEAMGRCGREAVAAKYTWAAEERKLLAIYSKELD